MTEQPDDPTLPNSQSDDFGRPAPAPNDLTPPEWKRTALIVWSLIGVAFAGGILMIALTWREAGIPRFPDGPDLSFEVPELRFPDLESPIDRRERREREARREAPTPPGMERSDGADARPVGEIDKPGGTEIAANAEAGVLSGGNGQKD